MAKEASIRADDGALLRGAIFEPRESPQGVVIVLHGVADHGYSMSGFAKMLNSHGYLVLLPDSRAHGDSGGEFITYGLVERHDVHRWVDLLNAQYRPSAIYGYGASLGGSILIQSLAVEPRFRAIVAECPFADFRSVAYDRLSQAIGTPSAVSSLLVEPALIYARLRYGLALGDASPQRILQASRTPLLLIHGTADHNIPIEHSRRLRTARPEGTELWEVPRAGHVEVSAVAGAEFERRVTAWFAAH